MRRTSRSWFSVVLAFALACVAAHALKAVSVVRTDTNVSDLYVQAERELSALKQRHAALDAQSVTLTASRERLMRALDHKTNGHEIIASWQEAALLAGMTPLHGPGLVITLNDKAGYNALVDPIESIVHDTTLLHVLACLADHGALAASINDVRITATPHLHCVGPTILLDNHRLAPPYVVRALGDGAALKRVIDGDVWLSRLRSPSIGVRIDVVVSDAIKLPPAADLEADDQSSQKEVLS